MVRAIKKWWNKAHNGYCIDHGKIASAYEGWCSPCYQQKLAKKNAKRKSKLARLKEKYGK